MSWTTVASGPLPCAGPRRRSKPAITPVAAALPASHRHQPGDALPEPPDGGIFDGMAGTRGFPLDAGEAVQVLRVLLAQHDAAHDLGGAFRAWEAEELAHRQRAQQPALVAHGADEPDFRRPLPRGAFFTRTG